MNTYQNLQALANDIETSLNQTTIPTLYGLSPSALSRLAYASARTIYENKLMRTSWKELSEAQLQDKVREAKQTLAIAHHYLKERRPQCTPQITFETMTA